MIKNFFLNIILKLILGKKEVKEPMGKIKDYLSGKKTYVVAISALIGVIIAWISGSMTDVEAIRAIIEAILAMTIRAGVEKSGQ